MTRNIKLTLEYDGTNFCGWQWQPRERTVQGTLQDAMLKLLGESPKIYAAGRTDAGVHALGQVANFNTATALDLDSIRLGLNSYFPTDVVVLRVEEVAEKFHARYSAVKRVYRYVISKRFRAIARNYSWFCKYNLDLERMRDASRCLIGEHVFTAFCKENIEEPHYLSNVEGLEWTESDDNVILRISANRFLHSMVRIIVGTMVDVGRGRIQPGEVKNILDSRDRNRAGFSVPPQGLFLEKICYPEHGEN
ncbi:MAG TPA: tRNA pseudouridine(38-40) synthase TruA [bacterium]